MISADAPALVLVNLGTPDSPRTKDVRRYLREFLLDPRVIEMPKALWRPILEGIILRFRPAASAEKYRSVWMPEGSPLLYYTRRQAHLLQECLKIRVAPAMRYGSPGLTDVLDELMKEGHRKIAILPAYPQYSASTIASVNDALAGWIASRREHPELRLGTSFPLASAYIDALEEAIVRHWEEHGRPDFARGDRLILSFHSIPVSMEKRGDPYPGQCHASAQALRRRLRVDTSECLTTFQSVFGPTQWVGPATIDTIRALGRQGTRRIDVICPGFVADCLETLEEIDQLNRQAFFDAGGSQFHYIPWGNDSPAALHALAEQARALLAP